MKLALEMENHSENFEEKIIPMQAGRKPGDCENGNRSLQRKWEIRPFPLSQLTQLELNSLDHLIRTGLENRLVC